jgi:eukaryotic-like serine/threonine-protein kinase
MNIKLPFELPDINSIDQRSYRPIVIACIVVISLMIVSGIIVFTLSLRGAEQTMVPDVRGMDIGAALVDLQEKELYPRVQLRFSQNAADKGTILDQKPGPGTIVKAGRRINLVVSRGVVIDKVENFVGQDLNEIKIHLQTLFTSNKPLLTIKEPPIYVYNKAAPGVVLEQKPVAGTDISGPTELVFVVSRGLENAEVTVPSLVGLSVADALSLVERTGIFFTCESRKGGSREVPATVVSQTPAPGSVIAVNARMNFVIAEPAKGNPKLVFGILKQVLPDYPYPLQLKAEAIYPSGERVALLTVKHPGGELTVPYLVPPDSTISVSILNKEVIRFDVKAPTAP